MHGAGRQGAGALARRASAAPAPSASVCATLARGRGRSMGGCQPVTAAARGLQVTPQAPRGRAAQGGHCGSPGRQEGGQGCGARQREEQPGVVHLLGSRRGEGGAGKCRACGWCRP